MIRRLFLILVITYLCINSLLFHFIENIWWNLIIFGPIILIGFVDMLQTKKAVRRNYPILGNFRYLMELVRPEIQQYFVESNSSGVPFSREDRSVVYQRAKGVRDTLPFGTQKQVYNVGYEWVNHSMNPIKVDPTSLRIDIGGADCKQPYSSSVLNVSAMSYGALSKNAIIALNEGAKLGNFAHNTGEGGISKYHLHGGDLIWQVGTGYFGCRDKEGNFNVDRFKENALRPEVKMIEIKLSQGAKPGGGGIVPASKVTEEIAEIRGVEVGKRIVSPSKHSAFKTPIELCEFIASLREASGGKPIGFKLCVGKRREFIAVCKAMIKTDIYPDYIVVDGSEGGTGAAPLEFSNFLGCPLTEAMIFVHNALVGFSIRSKIKLIGSGKVITGFGMVHRMAIGADAIYSARAMMMALGCIQAIKCNTNHCPVGVATQEPTLVNGLVVSDKRRRVASYHKETVKSLANLIGAMGLEHTSQLRPWHVLRRIDTTRIRHYGEIYRYIRDGDLLKKPLPEHYERAFHAASPESFSHDDSE